MLVCISRPVPRMQIVPRVLDVYLDPPTADRMYILIRPLQTEDSLGKTVYALLRFQVGTFQGCTRHAESGRHIPGGAVGMPGAPSCPAHLCNVKAR